MIAITRPASNRTSYDEMMSICWSPPPSTSSINSSFIVSPILSCIFCDTFYDYAFIDWWLYSILPDISSSKPNTVAGGSSSFPVALSSSFHFSFSYFKVRNLIEVFLLVLSHIHYLSSFNLFIFIFLYMLLSTFLILSLITFTDWTSGSECCPSLFPFLLLCLFILFIWSLLLCSPISSSLILVHIISGGIINLGFIGFMIYIFLSFCYCYFRYELFVMLQLISCLFMCSNRPSTNSSSFAISSNGSSRTRTRYRRNSRRWSR